MAATKKQIKQLDRAQAWARYEIRAVAEGGSKYARGLAGEGYYGGYRDAIGDVFLILNNVEPQRVPSYFEEQKEGKDG